MKIVYCIGSLGQTGGVERVLINKANFLTEKTDFQVVILIGHQGIKPVVYPISDKVELIDVKVNDYKNIFAAIPLIGFFAKMLLLKNVYQRIINEIKPDIIINVERGFEDFIIPKLVPHIPCIRESHSSLEAVELIGNSSKSSYKNLFFTKLYNKQLQKFDKVVCLTERDRIYRNFNSPSISIPNLISKFNIKATYDLDSTKVISVGRLDKFKNFKDQIIVWKEIVKLHPKWTLHIYGEGPEKNNLSELIQEFKLERNVFLEGKSSDIQEHYASSSFLIFTSIAEGFGMVLVEAMQMGLPVISYDCPCGPSDIIAEGEDGYLVQVSDLKILKNRILQLIENEDLRISMSKKAVEKSKNYLPEQIMPQWINLFEKMINGRQ